MASAAFVAAQQDLSSAVRLDELRQVEDTLFELRAGRQNVWLVASRNGIDIAALRAGLGADIDGRPMLTSTAEGYVCDFSSALGAMRLKIAFPADGQAIVHSTASLLPAHDLVLSSQLRDLFLSPDADGKVHTSQRGLRSGIVFASSQKPSPVSAFYFQDFSALNAFFSAVNRTPADTVGGAWPELGFRAPSGDGCVLKKSVECVISDMYLSLSERVPATEAEIAAEYLDRLAAIYVLLPRPEAAYHDWPDRAAKTLRDVSLSPECTHVRKGKRYLRPYVADETKPPESMVQLTALVNALEYDDWRGEQSALAQELLDAVPTFYDEKIGTVVRWLPEADFGEQSEDNMNHECMDSWYLYHSLFNLSRLATMGHRPARALVEKSLPFAIRVARRFDYHWPVFFNLSTLDIVRDESEPGKGGETDVAGLYALVMLHAHELFGEPDYLLEAKLAASRMEGNGFDLSYQLNTTGFGAEALLLLWQKTGDRRYLELSEVCMANLFDNMWLWQCGYGNALHYRTFFGLFPLHGAPYLAAYEELEAQAKFYEYVSLGGDDVRPSLKLLIAEYLKYGLDRGWFYYPDTLPTDVIAGKARNGRVERALSVPLEDLQDGRETSGQVGQELYGSGLAFIYATRHYRDVKGLGNCVFCSYPLCDFEVGANGRLVSFRSGGDSRGAGELRIIPSDPNVALGKFTLVEKNAKTSIPIESKVTPEGHLAFEVRGGQSFELRLERAARTRGTTSPRRVSKAHLRVKAGVSG